MSELRQHEEAAQGLLGAAGCGEGLLGLHLRLVFEDLGEFDEGWPTADNGRFKESMECSLP